MAHTSRLNAFGMPAWPRKKLRMRFPSYGFPPSSKEEKQRTKDPLTSLPTELRLEVYKHLFRGRLYAAVRFGGMLQMDIDGVKRRFKDQDIVNILKTCRLFRIEAIPLFRQLVTVAFLDADLTVAARSLFSTIFDPTELSKISIVGPYSDTCLPVYLQHKCPKMLTLQLTMFKDQFAWWEPLRILLDTKDTDLDNLAQNASKLAKLFLATFRYDWLANGRIAEVSDDIAYASEDWPRVLFRAPVVFEKRRGVLLKPDCDGGVGFFLPFARILAHAFYRQSLSIQKPRQHSGSSEESSRRLSTSVRRRGDVALSVSGRFALWSEACWFGR